MNEIITLRTEAGEEKVVFCGLRSITQAEFYQAYATDLKPEIKFVLADALDYDGERLIKYDDVLYRVLRTYKVGRELELVVTRASAEEVELYG